MDSFNKTIYLIDDDKIYQFTSKKILSAIGAASCLHSFENGKLAIDFIEANLNNPAVLPDVIFLDINMPIVDGWQFLEFFQELQPKIPKKVTLYMVTSSVDSEDIAAAKTYPAITEYIMKPVGKDQFLKFIQDNQ